MKKYVYLNTDKSIVLVLLLCLSVSGRTDVLPDEIELHGFLSQGFFHSSDNNLFGQSDDAISPGLTEIGLNVAYQPFDRLRFAAQGLYRRAGDIDRGSVRLDYGLADLTLLNYDSGKVGLRGGRIKIPYGLYNETRDVSFTHPTILLPQGIYFERSRSLLVSADGGSFYADQRTRYGDFFFKFNVGLPQGNNKEIMSTILGPAAKGEFNAQPAIAAQLSYELYGGKYIFALSYVDLTLKYQPVAGDFFKGGSTHIQPLIFSAQYNGEKFTLTGEYDFRWNEMRDYGRVFPDLKSITESWYVQGSYQILSALQATLRYDVLYNNIDDRDGQNLARVQLPNHMAFANDWMFGLRWDVTESLMLRTEYHRIHGTAWLPQADNPDVNQTAQDWDLYGLQMSFRF